MPRGTRNEPPKRLTKRVVDAARPKDSEYLLWDDQIPGFGLKVLPSGRKVFLFQYRTRAGNRHKDTLGAYGAITPDQARAEAMRGLTRVAEGGDPFTEKRDARRSNLDPKARFEAVVEKFIEFYAKPRQRTWGETRRTLLVNCAGWKARPIGSIAKAEIYDLLDGFVAAGQTAKARVTLAWLKTLFRWAVKRDIITASVVESVEIEIEPKTRDRTYSADEIAAVWRAADDMDAREGDFVKLLTLLAPRKGELAGMHRSEFDSQDKPTVWTIPHERTKTRKSVAKERTYIVPLPDLAQRIIRGRMTAENDLLFPGRDKSKPYRPGTALVNRVREKSGVLDWMPHGCRHTAASWFKDQGHSEYERGLVLNHSESSVTGDYSLDSYPVKLKRDLLDKWARHVEEIVSPGDAVQLR